ncbi:proline racemase family protein [Planococcus sp. 1R117A]|uniref:proline racemase family protein n=1 Tax=Planococcus sp. 1R117A TaxID=3447020 RepID=UPI003EDC53B5
MNFEKMFHTIDAHVAGEAFRIVLQSPIVFNSTDIHANHETLKSNFENEKNLLLNEPRGHRGMHGCIVGASENGDLSMLFFNHDGVPNFKYEGIIAVVTALIETGNLKRTKDDYYRVETVDGLVGIQATVKDQEVVSTSIQGNAVSSDTGYIHVDDRRNYLVDSLPPSIPAIELDHLAALNRWGKEKTASLAAQGIDYEGIIVVEKPSASTQKVRSLTFEKDGYILRSPGIDATFALLAFLGKTEIDNESIFGSSLTARKATEDGQLFTLETKAFVTGSHEFIFDQSDPLPNGFLLV